MASVGAGESAGERKVERASYPLTSVDPDQKKARDTVRDYYFFVFQLSAVVRPETLEPYGLGEASLRPMKEAYKRGDIREAKRLIPEGAIEALTVSGDPDHALERIEEYRKAGVTLPILMPIGNVDYAVEAMAPAGSREHHRWD